MNQIISVRQQLIKLQKYYQVFVNLNKNKSSFDHLGYPFIIISTNPDTNDFSLSYHLEKVLDNKLNKEEERIFLYDNIICCFFRQQELQVSKHILHVTYINNLPIINYKNKRPNLSVLQRLVYIINKDLFYYSQRLEQDIKNIEWFQND